MPLSLGAEMCGPEAWLPLLLLASFTGRCPAGELETSDLVTVVLGQDAKLPCFYRGDPGEQVEQVAWARVHEGEGGQKLALLNSKYGLYVSSAYEGRVEQPPPPRNPLDGAVLLRNAVQADEGEYECRVSTFPAGSFQAQLRLRVLVPPLPSLNPGPALEEGQGLTLAASCTAEGSPAPSVTWDTEVKGTTSSRSFAHSRSAAVTSEFHLVPSRSMNGQPLTCVVSHPGLLQDQRITHILQVAFLAEASVRGLEDQKLWQVGREGAMLKCLSEGQPPPSYNWTREEELTLTRENSIRRLHSHHSDPRNQPEESVGLTAEGHPDGLKDNSSCSVMRAPADPLTSGCPALVPDLPSALGLQSEEAEGRSYSTLTTVREIETQTELLSPGSGRTEEEEDQDEGIKQAMNHFVQENGTLRAKPTGNGIYINGRGHLV
ncbi:nectin-4 isoform X10 [Pseudorca crassidens]|uniref:nectin-4 isoform X10 n=1 Tax=Pseudorca crassidens TaxID=82174 RepID=UPI00352F3CCD